MFNKAMIAAAAALAIGGASIASTAAYAEPRGDFHGGDFRGGDFRGGGYRGGEGFRGGDFHGGYVGPAWGYGAYGGCGAHWSPYAGRYVRGCW